MSLHLSAFKLFLLQQGALHPQAWLAIMQCARVIPLKSNEGLQLKPGSFCYIAHGLLKEYDIAQRSQPRIVNFIPYNTCFYSDIFNHNHFFKAIIPTIILTFEIDRLKEIYKFHKEFKPLYNGLKYQYVQQLNLRVLIMERPVAQRLQEFKHHFAPCLSYLKKKDVAAYLNVSYNYLIANWQH